MIVFTTLCYFFIAVNIIKKSEMSENVIIHVSVLRVSGTVFLLLGKCC